MTDPDRPRREIPPPLLRRIQRRINRQDRDWCVNDFKNNPGSWVRITRSEDQEPFSLCFLVSIGKINQP